MLDSIFFWLVLLFVKHWYVDFVNQSAQEITGKGTYGNAYGVMHSIKHGLGTLLVSMFFLGAFNLCLTLAVIDFLLHYHIDWFKVKITAWRRLESKDPEFWTWFGADQLAHSLTYILLVWFAL